MCVCVGGGVSSEDNFSFTQVADSSLPVTAGKGREGSG